MDIPAALDDVLEPLSLCLDAESARRLIDFHIDRPVQARIEILGQRANEGILSSAERTEYEALINVADFIAILKLKVRRRLDQISRQRLMPEPAGSSESGPENGVSIVGCTKTIAQSYTTSSI